jgi:hypothetical protein
MEALDGWGYITAGVSFLAIGMVVFVHAWYIFATTAGSAVLPAVLALVHDLLHICVIASTRRILTTGAQIAYMEDLTDQVFHRYLLDLGANVLVIVALVVAVYMARRSSAGIAYVKVRGHQAQ